MKDTRESSVVTFPEVSAPELDGPSFTPGSEPESLHIPRGPRTREEQLSDLFDYSNGFLEFDDILGHEVELRLTKGERNTYKIIQPIGEGEDGTVVLVTQTEPVADRDKVYALKLGLPFYQSDLKPFGTANLSEEDEHAAYASRSSLREIHVLDRVSKDEKYKEISKYAGFELTPLIDARILRAPTDYELRMSATLMPYVEQKESLDDLILYALEEEVEDVVLVQTVLGIANGLNYLKSLGFYQLDPLGGGNIMLKRCEQDSGIVPVLIDMQRVEMPELASKQQISGFARSPAGREITYSEELVIDRFAEGLLEILNEGIDIYRERHKSDPSLSPALKTLQELLTNAHGNSASLNYVVSDLHDLQEQLLNEQESKSPGEEL